ncbi:mucin-15 [Nematolebias whitei]|uniref:mucin-15 n=1 Tax=Nematolebias whitei TaxID=451745 RepID=UPI001896AA77|nr:mucin-15 [Nematolebias whitei]
METLKITACFLLLFQVLHTVSLQSTTDSPGRTIDKSWLRQPAIKRENGNTQSPEDKEFESELGTVESGNDNSGGIPSGFMAENAEEEENLSNMSENEKTEDLNISNKTMFENGTIEQLESPEATIPPANESTDATRSGQTNMTEAKEEFNSTMTTENSTSTRDLSYNNTMFKATTLAPENGTTKQPPTTPDSDKGLANRTESTTSAPSTAKPTTGPPTAAPTTAAPNTTAPQINKNTSSPSEIPGSNSTAAPDVPKSPEVANRSGIVVDGSERAMGEESGLDSDPYRSKRNAAWLAVLGTAAATACVGVVAYIILKKKHQKAFTHRKLVEEYPADPVLRLDNCEPLDLNVGGSAYYNPALQGDNIQMNNFPEHR